MTVNQISIFLENKYGKLNEVLNLLDKAKIRIIAGMVADTSEYGIMRLIVSDSQRAHKLLKENNVSANLTDVLAIAVCSSDESFVKPLELFTKAGLSIEYMYCFSSSKGQSVLFLRTNNREMAREVIRRNNLSYICETDLIKL